ncbi:uncharacterized protein LOC123891371 isoform X2 [Trifolium pratense]|uniref:uncharacterized protein LOC123891371 isoform X2 n=1 Tax=Trifolium pratense TaxID=57577 RepID=UPI001E694884|nr:uncharacterized protein LOC123891371 isoform X2 [Trifolium pratense]
MTSPHMTSQDAPARMTPHRTLNVRNPAHSAPSSNTSSGAPLRRSSNVHPAQVASAGTSNVPGPHDVSHGASARTSNVPPPHVAHDVPRAASARTSNVPLPHVASPSNSQPYDSDGAETPILSENVDPSETQNSDGKQTLTLELQGFLPSYAAASAIGDIMRSNYSKPWNSWKKIPRKTRKLWFQDFKARFNFCPPDDALARKNFERRGAVIMKNNLNKARVAKKRPDWIDQNAWDPLCEHWRTSGFKKKSIQAKTNRESDCGGFSKPVHTCGSITTSQHRANLTELNGTTPAPVDLFVYTHQHRKNKAWVDRRSEHVYEKYKCRLEELTQQASLQGTPPPKELDVWIEVAGTRKGHIYGLGSESSVFAGRRNYRGSGSASTEWVQRHEIEELKIEREEMRRENDELRDMVKQLMESLNFRPKPYTRDEVHEDIAANSNDDVTDDNDDDMSDDGEE